MTQKASATRKTAGTPSASPRPAAAQDESGAARPGFDIRALLDRLSLPGVDVQALLESRRKDVEALVAANQRAYQGFEALTRRQAEILAEAMQVWQAGTREVLATTGAPEKANRSAGRAQQAFGEALASMRELAELAAKSHEDVVRILNKRVHEGLDELREQLKTRA